MSHVEFKKGPCRRLESIGRGPHIDTCNPGVVRPTSDHLEDGPGGGGQVGRGGVSAHRDKG